MKKVVGNSLDTKGRVKDIEYARIKDTIVGREEDDCKRYVVEEEI